MKILTLPTVSRALILRGILTWLAIRLGAAFAEIGNPNVAQELLILAAAGLAVWLDARRRGEDLFLANLGIPSSQIVLMAVVGPALLELLVP